MCGCVLPPTSRALALVGLVLAVATSGCSAAAQQPATGDHSVTAPPAPSPTPSAATWTERCTSQVSYWAGEHLSGRDGGYDYQEMGLSGTTNAALQAVITSPDRINTPGWIHAAAARECRARASTAAQHEATPGPGWPQ